MENITKESVKTLAKLMDFIADNLSEEEIEMDYDIKYGDFYASHQELKNILALDELGEERQKLYLDDTGYAYINTPMGRILMTPDFDNNYDGVYIDFQPYAVKDGVIPAEQPLAYVQDISRHFKNNPKIVKCNIKIWEDSEQEDYTYNRDININKDVLNSAK